MPRQEPGEPYLRVDSKEAKDILDKEKDKAAVIDVRRHDEWVSGHVRGAIHIPIDELPDRVEELPKDKKLLFICAAGVRSGLACEIAASMGLSSEVLYNIEDGTPNWINNNLPTDYGQ